MAVRVAGVPLSINGTEWSQLFQDLGNAKSGEQVMTGFSGAITGTRSVNVAGGRSLQAGTNLTSDAGISFSFTSSASPRYDTIVAQVDWANDSTGAPNTTTTAGSLTVVQGAPGTTPTIPTLTKTPGVLWQTPLWHVLVPTGTAAMTLIDARPGASSTLQTITVPGNFDAVPTAPLAVQRVDNRVEFGGDLVRNTATMTPGSTAINGTAIIPQGFRPTRTVWVGAWSNLANTPAVQTMQINPDGSATLYAVTGTITVGATIHFQTTTWLGA